MRIALGPTFSNSSFPSEYLSSDTRYDQIVFEDDLVDVEITRVRVVGRSSKCVGGG